jgi:hypothetical protein
VQLDAFRSGSADTVGAGRLRGRRHRVACARRRRESEVESWDERVIARNVPQQKEQRRDADSDEPGLHDADSGAGARPGR